jgi:hypothetical protein
MNPYGNNNGYLGGFLGNMTAGVEALQASERNMRMREIEQKRGWEHDEKLATEKLILEIGSTPVVNDLRVGLAKDAALQSEEMLKGLTDFQKKYDTMSSEDRMVGKIGLLTKMKQIQSQNQNAKLMIDAVEQIPVHADKIRPTLSGEDLELWEQGLVEFRKQLADPEASKNLTPMSVMLALQPKFSVGTQMRQFVKDRTGILEDDPRIGAKVYNPEATAKMFAQELKSNAPLTKMVNERYGIADLTDTNEAGKIIEENYRSDLSKNFTPGKIPTRGGGGSGKIPAADVVEEVPTQIESIDPKVKDGDGVSLVRAGRAFHVKIGDGVEKDGADFKPTQYVNGMMQGEFSGVRLKKREVSGKEIDKFKTESRKDSRIKIGVVEEVDGVKYAEVTYPEVDTWYGSVPYDQVRDEVKGRYPNVEQKYQEDMKLEPAKKDMDAREKRIREERLSGKSTKSTVKPKTDPLGLFN